MNVRHELRRMDPTTRVAVVAAAAARVLEGKPPIRVERIVGERIAGANPTYKLSQHDRDHLFILKSMGLWSNTALGEAFGVDRSVPARVVKTRRFVQ